MCDDCVITAFHQCYCSFQAFLFLISGLKLRIDRLCLPSAKTWNHPSIFYWGGVWQKEAERISIPDDNPVIMALSNFFLLCFTRFNTCRLSQAYYGTVWPAPLDKVKQAESNAQIVLLLFSAHFIDDSSFPRKWSLLIKRKRSYLLKVILIFFHNSMHFSNIIKMWPSFPIIS